MKKLLTLTVVVTLLLAANYFLPLKSSSNTHYHAGFTVLVNGIKQDFSDPKYMNYSVCSEHQQRKSPEEEQIELAHLHDGIGDVVHVHRQGAVWGDLFQNINFSIPQTVTGYREGKQVDNILNSPIIPNDSIMFVVGDPSAVDQSQYVSLDRIKEVEAKSELCSS